MNEDKFSAREYHKALTSRITQYRAVLPQADYVYITTDSILSKGCSFLWSLVCDSSILRDTPLILVEPALNVLKALDAYKDAKPEFGKCVSVRRDDKNAWEQPEYFSSFKYGVEHKRRSNKICPALHVISHVTAGGQTANSSTSSSKGIWSEVSEQQALQQTVLKGHKDSRQIVISQDVDFLRGLHTLCNSIPGKSNLTTLLLDEAGYLADPFDSSEHDLMTRISTNNLAGLVESMPLFIDDSALKHPQAIEFLNRVKPALLNAGKSLAVITSKNAALPQSDLLIARAQETPSTLHFVWLDDELDKTDALVDSLITESGKNKLSHVAFITDRVARAEKIQSRVAASGLSLDVYSINKYGFLSCRSASQNRANTSSLRSNNMNKLMESAVREGDLQKVQNLVTTPQDLEAGVKACLYLDSMQILESLVNQADRVPSRLIRWIITEFRQFQTPSYLEKHPRAYELIVKMLSKTVAIPLYIAEQLHEHLCDINDNAAASHAELEYLASLLKDACVNAVGSIMPVARIRRAMLVHELPYTVKTSNREMARKRELEAAKDKIRKKIAKLQEELSKLEAFGISDDNENSKRN